MKNLFILDGIAGTGKSDCIAYIREGYCGQFKAGVLQKYTTRAKRLEENNEDHKVDLNFITDDEFDSITAKEGANFLTYKYGDKENGYYKYGILFSEIDKAIESNQNTFVIIRNISCIKELINKYKNTMINVVPVFIYTDPYLVAERLRNDGYQESAIEFRTSRSKQVWDEYLKQATPLYRDIVINNSNKNDFIKFIDQLMTKYNQEEITSDPSVIYFPCGDSIRIGAPLIGHRRDIDIFLSQKPYEKNVFLMIKYRDNNSAIRKEISKRITNAGYRCILANENDITNDIYNPIALTYCCKYGIALFDEPEEKNCYSPNVAYELGIMQSQFKKPLVIKHKSLQNESFFDILKDEGNLYSEPLSLFNIIDTWIEGISKK